MKTTRKRSRVSGAGPQDEPRESNLPDIQITDRQLPAIYEDAWRALLQQNDPPTLFVTAGRLSRVEHTAKGWCLRILNVDMANGILARSANWTQMQHGKAAAGRPPREVAPDFLANPHPDLPELSCVVTSPMFSANGRLLMQSGYDADAAVVMKLDDIWTTVQVPDRPSRSELDAALDLLLGELLGDFAFKRASDRTHAVATIILPFVRALICGPTPLHYIGAPSPGSGKSLLADLIRIVTVGNGGGTTTLTTNESDTRKKITALLRTGAEVIVIDNVRGGIRSAELAAAITATVWSDRVLSTSSMAYLPNRALWLVTGTNLSLTLEIARRCLPIRLVPGCEKPWQRGGFRHPNIRTWATEHRHQLVCAVLTVIQSWVAAGMPQGTQAHGSFEAWTRVIGGIINHCGLPDFLGDADEFYAEADQESQEMAALVAAWWAEYQGAAVKARDLLRVAERHGLMAEAREGHSHAARDSKFGKALNALRDRRFNGLEVVFEPGRTGSREYRLRQIDPQPALEAKGLA